MKSAERIFAFASEHKEHETLILLAALSVMWLEPQNPEAKKLLEHYHGRGLDKAALREAALQLFLLAGFQASLEAFFQIKDVYGETLSGAEHELSELHASVLRDRGYALQAKVYGESVGKLRNNLSTISPELESWTVLVGYGLVMSRPGLLAHYRELLEIAVLAVQGFPRQLHSHFRGALNLGATREEVEITLHSVAGFLEGNRGRAAWQLWRHIR